MTSALAHPLYRAPSMDQRMHSTAGSGPEGEMGQYHGPTNDTRLPSPLPPNPLFLKDISRSSSSSTQGSGGMLFQQPNFHTRSASLSAGRAEEYNRQQQQQQQQQQQRAVLPGLTALASLASTKEPQMRSFSATAAPGMPFSQIPPVPTPGISGNFSNMPPVCQNCQTSTTPLWRRDESGSVLCNACGLFLKLHGRPRPISLKTDVIKSRNRVKASNQGAKKQANPHSLPASQSTPAPDLMQNGAHRRVSQMNAQNSLERSQSPISRTGTPSMTHDPNIAPQHIFDGVSLSEHPFPTPALPSLGGHPSPGALASEHMSYEQLLAHTTLLKTRVSELEVINMMFQDNVGNLTRERDEAVKAQEDLKRRVEELEQQVRPSEPERPSKKPRLDEPAASEQQNGQLVVQEPLEEQKPQLAQLQGGASAAPDSTTASTGL